MNILRHFKAFAVRRYTIGALALCLSAAFIFFSAADASAMQGRILFMRWNGSGNTAVQSLMISDGGRERVLASKNAYDPELSPDGRTAAFTLYGENGSRTIAVMDIASKKVRRLKVRGDNSYGPRWSPDGTKLVYAKFVDESRWQPAIYDLGRDSEKVLDMGRGVSAADVSSPFWAADGKAVMAQDLSKMWTIGTDGKLKGSVPLAKMFPDAGETASSAINFSSSQYDGRIVFTAERVGTKCVNCQNPDMRSQIYIYDPKTGTYVSPEIKGQCVIRASWIPGQRGTLLLETHSASVRRQKNTGIADIRTYSLAAGRLSEPVVKNGTGASAL